MRSLRCLKRGWMVAGPVVLLVLASCGDGSGPENALFPGQTDFVNNEPPNGGERYGGVDGEFNDAAAAGEKSAAPPSAAPQGRTAEVEEADIYKVDGNTLYYLNTYRGFLIYDTQDPKNPKLLSRLPVYGYPIEMFIQKNTVYALIRDALYLSEVKGKLQFKRHNTSQLVAIDISNLSKPKILQTVDIIGQLREGVSRKIEDTVYVVSYRDQSYYYDWSYMQQGSDKKEQAWVYSFNVADPKNLKLVDQLKVFEGGSFSYHDPNYNASVNRWFQGVTIAATSNALMVAENWYTYGWVSGSKWNCGSYTSQEQALVSIIDVSDPQGKIRLHTKFETYGSIDDQFKQTYVFDPKTQKGTYLGILSRREWSSANCQGSSFVQNTLESWDVTDGGKPTKQSELSFGKPNETVRGSVFDADRNVAFAITAQNVDPLYAMDFSDPTKLKVLSAIDGLSGDMTVFRFIQDKKFLLAIGRDNSQACTGFGDPTTGWSSNVAVSIIDVQDLSKIRLVQRKCVAVKNAHWVSSELTWNLDQAHKMIGMHSDGKINAITVPVYYYTKSGDNDWWWYHYETAVGLMTWDLGKYDPQKSELDQQVLENYGTIIHPKGQVRRSIVFTHQGTPSRRMVANLSDTHISITDIENLSAPVNQSMVEVAPFYGELYRFGSYIVEHLRPAYYYYYEGSSNQQSSEFRVKKVGGSLEEAKVLASFTVGQVERVVKYKDNLVLFRRVIPASKNGYYWNYETEILTYNLSNPQSPVKQASIKIPNPIIPYYWFWCGADGYWGGYWFNGSSNNWTVTDRGLAFLATTYDYQSHTSTRKLMFVDLSNPAAPSLKEYVLTSSTDWQFFGLVPDPTDSNALYLSYRIKVGQVQIDGSTFYQYKYYAQRWAFDGTAWTSDFALNLPGRLMKTWKVNGQKLLLTYDQTYRYAPVPNQKYSTWQSTFRLNLLRQIQPSGVPLAEFLDLHAFQSFYLQDVLVDGAKLFVNARHDYYYNQVNNISWEDQSDYLMIFDVTGLKLAQAYAEPTGTYSVNLMGTFKGRLFVNLPGDGVLMVDVSNPAQPTGLQFKRTLGYSTHLEFADDPTNAQGGTAYIAAGYFGVYQMDLAATSGIPVL